MLHPNFNSFPVIDTSRLLLSKTTIANAQALYLLRKNEDVMRYIDRPRPNSIEDIIALIEKMQGRLDTGDGIEWGLTHKEKNRYIGTISFHRIIHEDFRAEIGYLMDPAFHGQGLMQEAVQAVLNYGFHNMGLHSVEAHVAPENIASHKLLERCGFAKEAYFKQNHFWNGQFYDTVVYGLVTPLR
jgi:ribosomal-protein-alanine N-acetyltransferase